MELSTNECYLVVVDGRGYPGDEFHDHVVRWARSGAPPNARGGSLDVLAKPVVFAVNTAMEPFSLECACSMSALSLANTILTGQGPEPWPLLFSKPLEDVARSSWPVFELASAWARRRTEAHARDESPEAGTLFWRTCPSQEAFDFWTEREVMAAARAMGAAALHTGSHVSAAVARAAAVALLEHVNITALQSQSIGVCGILHWSLLAHGLAVSQPRPLVKPGYALRLFEAMLRTAFEDNEDEFMKDVVAAPWPVMTMVAEVVAAERGSNRSLNTEVVGAANASAEAPQASGRVAFAAVERSRHEELMDALRVADRFLEALGIKYMAICGTLLGAVRHMGIIPWDDDVDLCVDASLETKLFQAVIAEEALQLGLGWLEDLPWRSRRALQYLRQEGYVLRVEAARALTFRILRAGPDGRGDDAAPFVDIWLCWEERLEQEEGAGAPGPSEQVVVLMSREYGPKVPRSAVFPRRKLPFGSLAIWAPQDPAEVTRRYLTQGGWDEDYMNVCEGEKVHGEGGNVEYMDRVPCRSLVNVAEPWRPLEPGPEMEEVREAVRGSFERRLPGLAAPLVGRLSVEAASGRLSVEAASGRLSVEVASPGLGRPPRLRAQGWVRSADKQRLWCEALLWRGDRPEDDWLAPGARPQTGQVLRSLTCGVPPQHPDYVWEAVWA